MSETASITLTMEQWNVVGAALNELPRRVSDPVYVAIAQQIQTTQKPAAPPSAPGADEPAS